MMKYDSFKIVGTGGAGSRIVDAAAENSDFIPYAIDTDLHALSSLKCSETICIGSNRFSGIGTNGDMASAQMAADEDTEALARIISDASLLFIVFGLGGGAGSGIAVSLANAAHKASIPTVIFGLSPFSFEGVERDRRASKAIYAVQKTGAVYAICPNDELCGTESNPTIKFSEAMNIAGRKMAEGISMLRNIAMHPGYIRIDPAAIVSTVKKSSGQFFFGTASAYGADRANEAAQNLKKGLSAALPQTGAALIGICGGDDLRLSEIATVMAGITSAVSHGTEIKMGTVVSGKENTQITVSAMLFRSWKDSLGGIAECQEGGGTTIDAAARSAHAAQHMIPGRFNGTRSAVAGGEQLDIPTYIRRGIHIDSVR